MSWLGINYIASFQREQLLESRFEQLVSLREALASHVKDYEKSTVLAVETIAHDRTVVQALSELSNAYKNLESAPVEADSNSLKQYYQQNFTNRINTKIPNAEPLKSVAD